MSIASLAQGARQILARGLEALQTRDAPLGLLDVAQPVARAIGALVDLELEPRDANPARVEAILDALREALQLLQAPEHVEHPSAARGMKAVAEALSVVVMLARSVRESMLPGYGTSAQAPPASLFAVGPRDSSLSAQAPSVFLRTGAPMESALSAPAPRASQLTGAPMESTLLGTAQSAPLHTGAPMDGTLLGAAPPVALRTGAPMESTLTPGAPSVAASTRPSLRALAATSPSAEPAVVTRAVNAVMGPAPASTRVEAAPSIRADSAPVMRVEPASARMDPSQRPAVVPSMRAEIVPAVRVEAAPPRTEPSIALREPAQTPEPPPLISSRPPQNLGARLHVPSRAPVSIRRDVVAERDLRAVDAPLGAHSPCNFYTGLAGGDVVASGGLFVATYQVPKVGEKVLLKISMPGGYEFLAKAKVAWTRDATGTLGPGSMRAMLSAPGFGAQFCEITEEGRRLIQRYVRNREPLFHEDSP